MRRIWVDDECDLEGYEAQYIEFRTIAVFDGHLDAENLSSDLPVIARAKYRKCCSCRIRPSAATQPQ
jgi:hypothetical protein